MTLTLEKTWRKDTLFCSYNYTATTTRNRWLMFAWKELMLLGNNGVKAGPNAWTVVGSCDSTQFAMDGTDYWVDYTDVVSSSGNHSWVVLRNAAIGGGSGLELCIAVEDDTAYNDELTIAYSNSAGFTGGAIDARPTATDEHQTHLQSAGVFLNSTTYPFAINRLFSTDGECSRFFVTRGTTDYHAVMFLETLKSPTAMVDSNFFLMSTLATMTRTNLSNTGYLNGKVDGEPVIGRTSSLCKTTDDIYVMGYMKTSDSEGKWITDKCKLWSATPSRYGLLGELYDMYNIAPRAMYSMIAGAGGAKDFFSCGEFIFGNDGEVMRG